MTDSLDLQHTGRFCVAAFCMDFANGMFFVSLPYLGLAFGADSMQLGILTALRGATYILACVPAAMLSDRFNRKVLLAIAAGGVICVFAGTTRATALWQLFALGVAWAVAISPFWPAFFAWLGDSHGPDQLAPASGAVNLSWSIGGMLGGMLSGWLFGVSRALPFALAAIPAGLAALVMFLSPCTHGRPKKVESSVNPPGTKRELGSVWLGAIATASLLGLMSGVFPGLGNEIGVGATSFGFLMAGLALGRTLVFLVGMRRGRNLRHWAPAMATQLLAGAMVASVGGTESKAWLACVFLAIGAALGVNYYRGLFISLEGAGSRGLKAGLHEAALLTGVLLGSLGGGAVAKIRGLRAPYAPAGLCVLLLLVLQGFLLVSASRARRN